jgi:catechol 2,3-dioxygenase-like lactoylglutathione lyase family enzyme
MKTTPNMMFPMIVTEKLAETKRFYVEQAGFTASIDMGGYLQIRFGGEGAPELCFVGTEPMPDGTQLPPFRGEGVVVSVPTPNADALYDKLRGRIEVKGEPKDRPWGWRSFHAVDPNGVLLDFFHVIG